MMENEWKLGKDMFLEDYIFDPITFDELVMTTRCNCKDITENTVRDTAREIVYGRMDDYFFLVANNIEEIIREIKKQKGEIEDV